VWARFSAQIYVTRDDVRALAVAVSKELPEARLVDVQLPQQ
jgi:hypothetical protein